ncbi:MAG: hypothetical protein LC772_13085 [Chloroflexi bacterium]|nr:hypothetical protein [Chloroflexota bacterium]
MSWIDALLGRSRPIPASLDQLFGLSTAGITLETEFDLKSTGAAAVSFRPVTSGEFSRLQSEIDALLQASTRDAPLTWTTSTDSFGYQWITLRSDDYSNLITTMHMVSRELQDSGFGEQLLAAIVQFRGPDSRIVYWLYNYKRGTFYPFVPAGNQTRDNALEVRLTGVLNGELNVEPDLTKWYPLWGIPL